MKPGDYVECMIDVRYSSKPPLLYRHVGPASDDRHTFVSVVKDLVKVGSPEDFRVVYSPKFAWSEWLEAHREVTADPPRVLALLRSVPKSES